MKYINAVGEQTRIEILDYMQEFEDSYHVPPTVAEIAKGIGRAKSTVHRHLNYLIQTGYLKYVNANVKSAARGITLA